MSRADNSADCGERDRPAPASYPKAWIVDPSTFTLGAVAAFRPNAADQRHAEVIARHIEAAGFLPTPTVIFRLALAKLARDLDPPTIPDEVAARIFRPSAGERIGQ